MVENFIYKSIQPFLRNCCFVRVYAIFSGTPCSAALPRSLWTCECLMQQELIRRWDARTWRDISSYLFTYVPLNYDTPVVPEYIQVGLTHICYISNGRRFTKSALRILLLSTFRLCSINYSLVCSLPIHTRNSANTEGPRAHCQLKTWNRVKCCTIVRVLHLKRPAACERPSSLFKVTAIAAIW